MKPKREITPDADNIESGPAVVADWTVCFQSGPAPKGGPALRLPPLAYANFHFLSKLRL